MAGSYPRYNRKGEHRKQLSRSNPLREGSITAEWLGADGVAAKRRVPARRASYCYCCWFWALARAREHGWYSRPTVPKRQPTSPSHPARLPRGLDANWNPPEWFAAVMHSTWCAGTGIEPCKPEPTGSTIRHRSLRFIHESPEATFTPSPSRFRKGLTSSILPPVLKV